MDLLRFGPLRWLIKKRWFQFLTQVPNLVIFYLVIAAGFFGNISPGKNIATVITWSIWWFLLIFIFGLFGRSWCLICPFAATSDILQRVSFFRKSKYNVTFNFKWPNNLKNYYTSALFFLFILYMDFRYGVTTSPVLTAWIALIITGGAVIVSYFFEKRTYCRYVCPLALLNAVPTVFAPVAIRSRDKDVCKNCQTKECIKGSPDGWGCPLGLYPGGLDESLNCVLCMECIKTCPYDNMTVVTRPFGWEALRNAGEGLVARFDTGIFIMAFVTMMGMFPLFVIGWFREIFEKTFGVAYSTFPLIKNLFGMKVTTSASLSIASFYFFAAAIVTFGAYYATGYISNWLAKDKWKGMLVGAVIGAIVTSALGYSGAAGMLGLGRDKSIYALALINAIVLGVISYFAGKKEGQWRHIFAGAMVGSTALGIFTLSGSIIIVNLVAVLVTASSASVPAFAMTTIAGAIISFVMGTGMGFVGVDAGIKWIGFVAILIILAKLSKKLKIHESHASLFSGWLFGGMMYIMFIAEAKNPVSTAFIALLALLIGNTIFSSKKDEWINYGTLYAVSMVPYGIAIHLNHNWMAFLGGAWQTLSSLSDPLGLGWNLAGTAGLNKAGVVLNLLGFKAIFNSVEALDHATQMLVFYLSHATYILGFAFTCMLTWRVSTAKYKSKALHVYLPFFVLLLASLIVTYNTTFHVSTMENEVAVFAKLVQSGKATATDMVNLGDLKMQLNFVRNALMLNAALSAGIISFYVLKWRNSEESKEPPMEFKAQV